MQRKSFFEVMGNLRPLISQQCVLQSVDSRVEQIHDAVPSDSLLMVFFGCGNLSLVKKYVSLFIFSIQHHVNTGTRLNSSERIGL